MDKRVAAGKIEALENIKVQIDIMIDFYKEIVNG